MKQMSTAGSFQAWRTSRADAGVEEEVCAGEGEPDALGPVGTVPCEAPRSTLNLKGLFSPFAPRANTLFSFSISTASSRGELTAHTPLRRESSLRACEMMTAPSAADTIPNGYQPRQLSDRALVFPRSNPCSILRRRDRYIAVLSPPKHNNSQQQQKNQGDIW